MVYPKPFSNHLVFWHEKSENHLNQQTYDVFVGGLEKRLTMRMFFFVVRSWGTKQIDLIGWCVWQV